MNETKSPLKEVTKSIKVEVKEKFDPKEYFKTRDGLYIWSSFPERILEKAKPMESDKSFDLSSFDLVERASDEKIESGLPESHIFSESDVCAIAASLIEKQPKGEDGVLLANGYANLFYTPAFVVDVGWVGGEWGVFAWGRGVGDWSDGNRVFSPATDLSDASV